MSVSKYHCNTRRNPLEWSKQMKKIVLLIFVVVLLAGCVPEPDVIEEHFAYEVFHVEGMPCLRFSQVVAGGLWGYDGWTCDWSRWDSE